MQDKIVGKMCGNVLYHSGIVIVSFVFPYVQIRAGFDLSFFVLFTLSPQRPHPDFFDIFSSKNTAVFTPANTVHVLSLKAIHSVLLIMRSQTIFAYIMNHVTFDLVTPKSTQFIGSARYIHDLSFAGIHQSVLEITRSREQDVQMDGQPENNASDP